MFHYMVTGAAGFIGSKVCELLLEDGHSVVGIDNLNNSCDIRLKQWRLGKLRGRRGFQFQKLDICEPKTLESLFQSTPGIEAVLHLAARAGVRQSVEDPEAFYEANVRGTLNLLQLCSNFGVGKFVLASSSSLYGEPRQLPFVESMSTDNPLSPYAASKKAAEALTHSYHHLAGLDVTVLRYFTVYGPAGRPDMSPYLFVQWICEGKPVTIYGDGSQSRDYTYVEDIARGTVLGLARVGYEIINLGSEQPVRIMDFVRLVEDAAGHAAVLRFSERHRADVRATWADTTKARRLLGWSAGFSLEKGIRRLVDWYQENRSWAREIRS